MDLPFLQAIITASESNEPFCVLRKKNKLLVCTNPESIYEDFLQIGKNEFVTGYQNADGKSGQWFNWSKVEVINNENTRTSDVADLERFPLEDHLEWETSITKDDFTKNVLSMIADMKSGEYFLANITRMLSISAEIDEKYLTFLSCLLHDTPYRFLLSDNDHFVLGLSPERFLRIENNTIICEPMKGTATDLNALIADKKEFNENTMMIDLVRSDLSKVCSPDTIELQKRSHISSHPGLVQMSSLLTGTLELQMLDAIKEMMPIASVTGTPKPHVDRIIKKYEKHNRDIYCGTYGWIDTGANECDLAVAIRTIVYTNNKLRIGVGAGITHDSIPDKEYEETELKASRLINLVNLCCPSTCESVFTTTLLSTHSGAIYLDRHCERLSKHAQHIGIDIGPDELINLTNKYIHSIKLVDNMKLKITVNAERNIYHSVSKIDNQQNQSINLGLTLFPYLKDDTPKYTDRKKYEHVLRIAQLLSTRKISDALLIVNGHVTETTRANIFIRSHKKIYTPKNNLLHGIARDKILNYLDENGYENEEVNLTIQDISAADELIICNSLRGAQQVNSIDSALITEPIMFNKQDQQLIEIANKALSDLMSASV